MVAVKITPLKNIALGRTHSTPNWFYWFNRKWFRKKSFETKKADIISFHWGYKSLKSIKYTMSSTHDLANDFKFDYAHTVELNTGI